MELNERALELGRAIRETAQYQELQRADVNLRNDKEAQEIVKNMQEVRQQIEFMQKSGVQPNQEQIENINSIQEKMETNITVLVLMKAQEKFGELLQQVNDSISEGISGGELAQE